MDQMGWAREMSPSGCAALFFLVLMIDYLAIGPAALRDRAVLFFGIAAWKTGFDGSQLDQWTLEKVTGALQWALNQDKLAYISGASAAFIVGVAISGLATWVIGAMVPNSWGRKLKLDRVASIKLPKSGLYKINWKVQGIAATMGMFSDLAPGGLLGGWVNEGTKWTCEMAAPVIMILFGAV